MKPFIPSSRPESLNSVSDRFPVPTILGPRSFLRAIGFGLCALAFWGCATVAEEFRVMTFNLWVGGESGKQPLSQSAKVITAAKADIVGLQEALGTEVGGQRPDRGREIASLLGWNYFAQGYGRALLTRHTIVEGSPRKWGARIRLASGKEVWMFNVHFAPAPYQPYQLLRIPYGNGRFISTSAEAVEEAIKSRGDQVRELLEDIRTAASLGWPVFLTGDFNEPSHRDWTDRANRAGLCPLPVPYPSTLAVEKAGFRDAYRVVWPDEAARTGWTWTPTTLPNDPKDRHDRIDFVFYRGTGIVVRRCEVVGEDRKFADIVVTPYPSDHRAVVGTFVLP